MDINNQYSVVVLPKEAWDEIVKILGELKAKVDGFSTIREDEWLNSKAVREYLGISSRQFQKYRDERRIPFSQLGRKIYVKRSDLNEFLQKNRIRSRYEY